jgi:hypothetical protein
MFTYSPTVTTACSSIAVLDEPQAGQPNVEFALKHAGMTSAGNVVSRKAVGVTPTTRRKTCAK